MGDRANIHILNAGSDDNQGVYLYTHWGGSELLVTLQRALISGKNRWSDDQYLTRIIFCEMVKGQEAEETGFGITSTVRDGEDRVIVVNTETQTVIIGGTRRTFQEYIDWDGPSWYK